MVNAMKKVILTTVKIISVILSLGCVLYLLQCLVMPKYTGDVVEGAFVGEYYEKPRKDYDVIFVGDCEVYENFSPMELWQEYGIHSYIRGSAQQLIWQSYYMLEDTLLDHTPKAVVFNIQSLQYNEPQSEAYNRMTLDGMRWSLSKLDAIDVSKTGDEHLIEYVFPLLRYHSRISELTEDDVTYMFDKKKQSYNGYYMRTDILPAENVPEGRPLSDYAFGMNAWHYLDRIRWLCEDNGIDLILVKAPSLYPYWYDEYEAQVEDYAKTYGLPYYNFLELADEIGIDYSVDTYDGGLHMNLSGARKLSHYLGQVLVDRGIPDRRDDAGLVAIYEQDEKEYKNAIVESDDVPPVLELNTDKLLVNVLDPAPVAEDLVKSCKDGTNVIIGFASDYDFKKPGTFEVEINAVDEAGNKTSQKIPCTVIHDVTPPKIEGVEPIVVPVGGTVSYKKDVTVTDDYDPNPTLSVDDSAVDLTKRGKYDITYTATDASGNSSTAVTTVTVSSNIIAEATEEVVYAKADEVLSTIITDDMTQLEQARAVFDWVVNNITYSESQGYDDVLSAAYRGFYYHIGDCTVKQKTAEVMLDRLGIKNMEIEKIRDHRGHYWLLIDVGEGWYHYDPNMQLDGTLIFYWHDADLWAYSNAHHNTHNYDPSRYPEIQ